MFEEEAKELLKDFPNKLWMEFLKIVLNTEVMHKWFTEGIINEKAKGIPKEISKLISKKNAARIYKPIAEAIFGNNK